MVNLLLSIICAASGAYIAAKGNIGTGVILIALGVLNIPFAVKWFKGRKKS